MRTSSPHRGLIFILSGAVLGVLFGSFFPSWALRCGFLGDLFLNALKMMVLPLVVTSIIVGVTGLGHLKAFGSLGIKTIVYYLITTAIAVLIGIVLVKIIRPGEGVSLLGLELSEAIREKGVVSFTDVLFGLIHPNLFQAAAEFQILPLIVASIFFGVAFVAMGERARPALELLNVLNEAVMTIVKAVMFFAPLGIFGLIAYRLGVTGGGRAVLDLVGQLGKYFGTVIFGLGIHGLIVLPLVLVLFARRSPWNYMAKLGRALVTAFATASSSATLPVTMRCVSEDAGVSRKVSGMVLPVGATVNMDGTALYEAVAAIFIAQAYGIFLGFNQECVIFLTATLAAIGAAGIPEAGLVTMVLVLQSVGLPTEGIGLILAIDWLLDRFRTTVNVLGDCVGAAVIDRFSS